MTQKYIVHTYGCQMNDHDSEILAGMLQEMGYQPTDDEGQADIILLNTCCVRETAENKIWGKMGELTHIKSQNPAVILGICGCMAQQKEVAEKIRQKAPHMDLIFGTHNVHQLPELIERAREMDKTVMEVWETEGTVVENLPARRVDGVKALVTIMYGCNNYCTYCIVPYVRGRERSRQVKDIIQEIEGLVAEGYQEAMLLGQNVNSYGKDLEPKLDFADLLEEVDKIAGLNRIRFTTSHPRDFNDKLIDVIARSEKICDNIHLPVQAGSNRILKAMNRGYTKEYYLDLVDRIKKAIPHVALTTDLIVGFPGESEEDFLDTLDLVEKVQYSAAFTFVYNTRSGTPAAEMADQVPAEVKKERITRLIELQNFINLKKNQAEVGRVLEVLVEGSSKTNQDMLSGKDRANRTVVFPGSSEIKGKLVSVKIHTAKTWNLEGEMI
ncbi:MAG: tRNA (N6-isopentenyl adenosine(37)-C2)-methylthiotransferase MiaB [Clostridia bacterium]|nr:tRNA (N6-isopentenyl adenosine(37)-C2)-methylthiotransferase MiaB [Clostridia bacterium]